MKSTFTYVILTFLLFVGSVSSYPNVRVTEIHKDKVSTLSNGTIQCNTEEPIPLAGNVFDNLTSSFSTSGLCVLGCGISNISRLTDTNLSNYATVTTAIGVGVTHRLRVTDNNDVFSSGTFAGFRIAPNGGILSVELLDNISIKTYLGGTLRESFTGTSLISLSLLSSPGNYIVGFNTSQSFDAIEISINSLVGVSTSTNVYYAVIRNYCAGPDLVCNTPTRMNLPNYPAAIQNSHTGLSGIGVGSIINPESAISSSTIDYAGLNLVSGVAGSVNLAVKDQITDYPTGTYAGFEIENSNLVTLSAIGNVQVKTYLNGSFREQFSGNNLLVNGGLLDASGRYKLGFVSTLSFDEIQISINQTVGLNLGLTKVFGAVFQKFCAGPPLPCNTQTAISAPTYPVFINGVRTGIDGIACVACSISNSENLIDANTSNYALIDLTASVGTSGKISVKEQITDYPAGTFAGFDIEGIALLNANVFDAIRVTTYLNGIQQETKWGSGALVSVNTNLLIGTGRQTVGFVSAMPFDEVQIALTNTVTITLGTVKVYSAVLEKFCPTTVVCNQTYPLTNPTFPVTIDGARSGINGVACAACAVNNANNVLTPSTSDYANISITVGALASGSLAVADQLFTYPSGTIAGFTIKDLNNLIELDLFQILTIATYNNGQFQESRTGAQLLSLSLLTPIFGSGPGFYNVGFKTTLPFDEIQIKVGSLASAISNVNVYGAFVNTKDSNDGGGPLFCVSSDLGVVKTVSNVNPPVGSTVVFTIVASNSGPRDADGVVVNDLLPSGYTYVSSTVSTGSFNNSTGVWNIGNLNSGANVTLTITVIVNATGNYVNTATIVGNQPDPNPNNNTSTSTTTPVNVIIANDDTGTSVNGYAGGTSFTNVLVNDTINGQPVLASQVNTTFVSSTNAGITLSGTSVVVAPGTPAGSYSLVYQICEKLNPSNCDTATVSVTVTPPVIVAQDDTINGGNGTTGNPNAGNVLANNGNGNDTLNGTNVTVSQVNITVTTPATPINGNPVPVINPSTGQVSTPSGTPAGNYTLVYQICEKLNPANCDSATVTVTVTPPQIDAVNDIGSSVNGYAGGTTFTNVLVNDTLNGQPVLASQVNTTFVSSTNAGITLSGTSVVVAPGTPAGSYSLVYQICEKLNPSNCDTATVSVTVTPPVIVAQDDTINGGNGTTGNPNTGNVLANNGNGNDTLNGTNVTVSQVNITVTTPATPINGNPVPVINPSTGQVSIPSGTPAGNYTLVYQICEKLNPANCDSATVIVTVTPPLIVAQDDNAAPIGTAGGTAFTNVLVNDTLNGQLVSLSQINLTSISSSNSGITLQGTNVVVASGTPPGNYTLVYQICEKLNPTNCDQATVFVTVTCEQIVAPTASVTAQPTCTTATGTITVSSPAPGTGISYTVTGTNPVVAPQSNTTGLFSGLAPGVYSVTTSKSGCTSAAVSLTVNPQPTTPAAPTASVTAQPTCTTATGTITVSAPAPGIGISYTVTGTNPVVAPQSNTTGVFSGLAPGVYSVTTSKSGCTSAAVSLTVNLQPTTCNVAGIFHTNVTCTDYRNNASSQLIGQLCYATRSNKVSNVTPGQFFYYTSITAPSSSFCVEIIETKSCSSLALFSIQQSNQITLYNASCSNVASGIQVSLGLGRVCINNAVPGAQYILSVKYDSKSVVGSTFTGTAPICQYSFESRINGVTVANSSTSINMVPNCSTALVSNTGSVNAKSVMSVVLAPNPSTNDFELQVESSSSEEIIVKIAGVNGSFIREIKSTSKENIRFGEELSRGMYFIEVIQGEQRKVVRALKL
ncbi:T9SS type A sorting domain-containing protein [Flavobacterium enshiense]|uniref:T9SS type A sorting domain-containing protein n=1 Tax=Flavobacterium enshiense TaxID=1341165 RepID=UPI00345DF9E4